MGIVAAFTVAKTASGWDDVGEWPFVTLSSFQERTHATRRLSLALQIGKAPIVSADQRAEWEYYCTNTSLWLDEAIQYQEERNTMELDTRLHVPVSPGDALNLSSGMATHIFDFGFGESELARTSPDRNFYLPLYQVM